MKANKGFRIKNMKGSFRLALKVLITPVLLILAQSTTAISQDLELGMTNQPTLENIRKGKSLYEQTCSYCHGLDGRGDGPASYSFITAPKDFTTGIYKFRRTETGNVPTDWDLYESITKGIHGTSMIRWKDLSEEQRWQLVAYIKTFSDKFQEDEKPELVTVGVPPRLTRESIIQGKQFFIDAECWTCHGYSGKGDGPSANKLKDNFGKISIPRDLTIAKNYGRGSSQEDIYITLVTGLDGTPMPSYKDAFEDMDEELWDLVNYVYSLSND